MHRSFEEKVTNLIIVLQFVNWEFHNRWACLPVVSQWQRASTGRALFWCLVVCHLSNHFLVQQNRRWELKKTPHWVIWPIVTWHLLLSNLFVGEKTVKKEINVDEFGPCLLTLKTTLFWLWVTTRGVGDVQVGGRWAMESNFLPLMYNTMHLSILTGNLFGSL